MRWLFSGSYHKRSLCIYMRATQWSCWESWQLWSHEENVTGVWWKTWTFGGKLKILISNIVIIQQTRYNMSGDVWDGLGEKLSHSITTRDGVREQKETVRSWRVLISCIIDEMRVSAIAHLNSWAPLYCPAPARIMTSSEGGGRCKSARSDKSLAG